MSGSQGLNLGLMSDASHESHCSVILEHGDFELTTVRRSMAPRKGCSPFSRVKSPELDSNKQWYVLNASICGDRPPKFYSGNKFPARFPDDFKRVQRSGLQTLDGAPFHRRFKEKPLRWMKS